MLCTYLSLNFKYNYDILIDLEYLISSLNQPTLCFSPNKSPSEK